MASKTAAPLHRHMQFAISAGIGAVAGIVALLLKSSLAYSIGANAFFIVYIAIVLWQMPMLTADYLSKNARATDQPVGIIFIVTLVVIGVAVVSLFQLINSKDSPDLAGLLFSLTSVPLGWFTLQAMTALHYAHVYWMDDDGAKSGKKVPVGGLEFPGKDRPDGWDFLYFAATIGMTFQTSDTEITTTEMRRITLLHAVVSFFFNTVIVAAAVNLAVSLGD
ncbi:DUF1345 domain-containing protein [Mesorhizobium sp. BE184]|uniref:DUF1345 domain-containing protein n=1 Tax=Mesorhizobium sp. BE184 TaxID=2817714 RepID=UPI0028592437|nr:DUF1345 domain-containing protein [Mesorhizobium sp. BE184]MDR7032585.1 putative membrane protein [Mesorhizobium sp. BE184]